MHYGFLRILFGFGLVFGLLFGVHSLFCHGYHHGHGFGRRAAFEDHVADVCLRAAERARETHAEK